MLESCSCYRHPVTHKCTIIINLDGLSDFKTASPDQLSERLCTGIVLNERPNACKIKQQLESVGPVKVRVAMNACLLSATSVKPNAGASHVFLSLANVNHANNSLLRILHSIS